MANLSPKGLILFGMRNQSGLRKNNTWERSEGRLWCALELALKLKRILLALMPPVGVQIDHLVSFVAAAINSICFSLSLGAGDKYWR